jgi:hypothetical protein
LFAFIIIEISDICQEYIYFRKCYSRLTLRRLTDHAPAYPVNQKWIFPEKGFCPFLSKF